MEEKTTRQELNESLYREDHKLDIIDSLLYFLFLCIFIMLILVFSIIDCKAVTSEWDITNTIWSTSDCEITQTHLGYYCAADSNVTNDLWSKIQVGNNAAGNNVLSISFLAKTSMLANSNHTIELHGLRYNNVTYSCSSNVVNCSVSYVSTSQLNINFTSSANGISSAGVGFTITAYPNSFNGNNIFYINQFKLLSTEIVNSGGGSSSGFDDTGIITSANQNKDEIINNQNENTQQITNSLTSMMNLDKLVSQDTINTQRANLQNMCKNSYDVSLFRGYTLTVNGSLTSSANTLFSDFTEITNTTLCIQNSAENSANLGGNYYVITYKSDKSYLGAYDSFNRCINLPSTAKYFRVATKYPGILITKGGKCETSEDQIKELLYDDNVSSGTGNSFFNDFTTTDPGSISQILTKPLVVVNNLLSSYNSCTNLNFSLTMPGSSEVSGYLPSGCIFWNNVNSNIISLWNIFVVGVASYWILCNLFKTIDSIKNPNDTREEVLRL